MEMQTMQRERALAESGGATVFRFIKSKLQREGEHSQTS